MKKTIWIIISSLVIAGCTNSNQSSEHATTAIAGSKPMDAAHQHAETKETIELNNGEKWLVNAEMKPYIEAGEQLLAKYQESNSGDYETLASGLKEKNTALIKSCTMQGKSHEELHKWLHPHLELVSELGKAGSLDEANHIVAHLQESFALFHQYFQ